MKTPARASSMNQPMLKILALTLSFAAPAVAQNPLFAQVGDPFPDGMGQATGAADFEGDGDVDVFTSTGVFLNVNGFFTPGPRMPAGFVVNSNFRSVAIAELTGDGRVDILIGYTGLKLYAAPPAGGAFFALSTSAFPGAPLALSELCVADFDGDGDIDVIGASSSPGTPLWQLYLNDGLGTFTAASAAQWPAAPTEASWVAAGDFDGDG